MSDAELTTIRVGHSPDSDDAFMFYALTHDKLDTGGLRVRSPARGHRNAQQACPEGRAGGLGGQYSRLRLSGRALRAARVPGRAWAIGMVRPW